jgi:hypothetical protein
MGQGAILLGSSQVLQRLISHTTTRSNDGEATSLSSLLSRCKGRHAAKH